MMTQHMKAIAMKEFLHILRDPGTLLLVTLGPIFLMVIFTYTMTADVRNAPIAIIDLADSDASHELIRRIDDTETMEVVEYLDSEVDADALFERGVIVAAITIPAKYGEFSLSGNLAQVSAVIDGTEPVSAEKVLDEVYRLSDAHTRELAELVLAQQGVDTSLIEPPVAVDEDHLFNPDLSSVIEFYPGLAGMMLGLPAVSLAMSLARENENGTLEQLVATPIDKRALLMGKMMPYLVFGMVDVYILLALGRIAYDVPFEGNLLAYSLISFLFLFANLGLGLLIAVFIRSQQVAMLIAVLVFFIPPFFMSGIFFPQDAMPWIVQLELIEFPATHYVTASKAIHLQGASLRALWFPTLVLLILAVELLEIAAFAFRKKVVIDFPRFFRRKVAS